MKIILIVLTVLVGLTVDAGASGTLDDYLCRVHMEQAMRAHDALPQADKELQAKNPNVLLTGTISNVFTVSPHTGLHLCDDGIAVCYGERTEPEYKPDTRTDDQKFDDEIAEIERKRVQARKHKEEQRQWERAKELNKAQHDEAERLWTDAKKCWRNP